MHINNNIAWLLKAHGVGVYERDVRLRVYRIDKPFIESILRVLAGNDKRRDLII